MSQCFAVTGSASGIGRAVCDALAAEGHRVIGLDRQDADIVGDLSSPEGRDAAASALLEAAPDGLDGFVPCAGVGGHLGLSREVVEVNYFGSVHLLEAIYPVLLKRKGVVVVIGSNSMAMPNRDQRLIELLLDDDREAALAHVTDTTIEPYPSAKVALCIWMRRRAVEWMQQGVRMNAIAPGMTETNLVAMQRESSADLATALEDFASTAPVGYAADAETIANVILFLLSPTAHFICGEVLYADGGHAARFKPEHV